MQISVRLAALPIPKYLDFHSGIYSYSRIFPNERALSGTKPHSPIERKTSWKTVVWLVYLLSKNMQKKKKPDKCCVVMFCNKTSLDGEILHKQCKQIAFVFGKRDDNWKLGSGHICSLHFSPDCYKGLGAKIVGYASRH